MNQTTDTTRNYESGIIRSMVRGIYSLQDMRIQIGNRVTGNFKAKLGLKQDGMSEAELEKQEREILDTLRNDFKRITDGVIAAGSSGLPTLKKFKGEGLITNYTELVLVNQYVTLLDSEEGHFKSMATVLKQMPIYTDFLTNIQGIGPAMAGIIISEIDIHRAQYPSSLWKLAGLDTVTYGVYTDGQGKEQKIPAYQVDAYYGELYAREERNMFGFDHVFKGPEDQSIFRKMVQEKYPFLIEGKYPVTLVTTGRNRKAQCLVKRQYIDRDGNPAECDALSHNPWLKTKLIGVLGSSFLRAGTSTVDGARVGTGRRLEMAVEKGFVFDKASPVAIKDQAIAFLKEQGHDVVVEGSKYGQIYYNYKNRLRNMPAHATKSDGHLHNMATRYAVKIFLNDLYDFWRKLENLPVAVPYHVAKLGLEHGVATAAKEARAA